MLEVAEPARGAHLRRCLPACGPGKNQIQVGTGSLCRLPALQQPAWILARVKSADEDEVRSGEPMAFSHANVGALRRGETWRNTFRDNHEPVFGHLRDVACVTGGPLRTCNQQPRMEQHAAT